MVAVTADRSVRGRLAAAAGAVTTALLYTRVSSDEQAQDGLSLDAQVASCRRYAAEHGWIIGSEYTDVLTGKRDDRPEYQSLLSDVRRRREEGQRVVVVVAWLHRFGRRVLERVRSREELKGLGVALHSAKEGGEVSDLVSNILASVAEEEVRQLGERVRETNNHTRSLGWHPVGWVPWGYRWRDASPEERAMGAPRKVLDEDPIAAPYVREAFTRVAAGEGLTKIRGWLVALPPGARNGRAMGGTNIAKALRNPTYIGRDHRDRERGPVADVLARSLMRWPALVDEQTWLTAQASLDSHQRQPHQATGSYLLTGFLRCPNPDCGARMCGRFFKRDRRYVCVGHTKGTNAPDTTCRASASAKRLERAVLEEVGSLLATVQHADPAFMAALRREWKKLTQPAESRDTTSRVKWLDAELERSRQRISAATDLFVDRQIDKAAYDDKCSREQAKIEAHGAERARLTALGQGSRSTQLPPLEVVLERVTDWTEAFAGFVVKDQRASLAELVERVVANRVAFAVYEVDIKRTPLGDGLAALRDALAPPKTVAA